MSPGNCPRRENEDGVGIMIVGVTVGRGVDAGNEGETKGAVLEPRLRRGIHLM